MPNEKMALFSEEASRHLQLINYR